MRVLWVVWDWILRLFRGASLYPIASPENARGESYAAELRRANETGVCPFCPGGSAYTEKPDELIRQTLFWTVKKNNNPIKGSEYHFVLYPRRHIMDTEDLSWLEMISLVRIRRWLRRTYGLRGTAFYGRSGNPELIATTVGHIHFQIIQPLPGECVPVYFGKFKKV